jgi:5'-phosphate synthase pdxT subunit
VAGNAIRIGLLALQGAFREHRHAFDDLEVETVEVRKPADLDTVDGLVIPGGESTTIRLLLREYGVLPVLRERIAAGFPVMGTCAGMIVLADTVDGAPYDGLAGLDIAVLRNAFGRQVDSFEQDLDVPTLGGGPFHAVFIRAPVVDSVEPGVDVLAKLDDGRVVAVREGSVLGLAFHPEMTTDRRFHQLFLDMVCRARRARTAAEESGVELPEASRSVGATERS